MEIYDLHQLLLLRRAPVLARAVLGLVGRRLAVAVVLVAALVLFVVVLVLVLLLFVVCASKSKTSPDTEDSTVKSCGSPSE